MIIMSLFYKTNNMVRQKMEPILQAQFTNFKNTYEIDTNSNPDKESQAFERFINYILFSLDYPGVFTGNLDLLDFVSVGGGLDTGIDGIGIKINDRLVQSIEEVKEITQVSKKVSIEFIFIQSKMRSGFETSEFTNYGTGVKVFFSEGYLPENSKIADFRKIKDFIYADEQVIHKLDKNPSLYLYYVGTGKVPIDDNFNGAQKWLEKEIADNYYFDKVEIKLIGGKQLLKYCRELDNKFEVQINIIDIFPLIVSPEADVKKAYAFTCSAIEFFKIIQKEDGTLRRSLFNDNVRDYLGNKGAVNSEIESTIMDDPEMFLLCNNGITIVCSGFEQVRDKLVRIENPQIVNGCQTSNSLYNLKSHQNISKIQLLVRLISTENLGISNKIVRGTNKQNLVLDEAFEATLPFHQEILEPFFLAVEGNEKIYYERRSKQYSNDPLIQKTHIVNLRILTQTFVAVFLEAPHESHLHESKLLAEYAGNSEHRKIFKESHSPYPYYICALIWFMFEKYFREDKIDNRYKIFKSHLYLAFKYSLGLYSPNLNNIKALEAYCQKIKAILADPSFGIHAQKATLVFAKTYDLWIEKKSRHTIKDNKDFSELLITQCRKYFMNEKDAQYELIRDQDGSIEQGEILTIRWRDEKWYGFIKRGYQFENIYFDNRGFGGNPENLRPTAAVEFEIGQGKHGYFAKNVKLLNS